MGAFWIRNGRNIRESIERVDREERKNQEVNQLARQLLGIDYDPQPSYNLASTTQQAKKTAVAMIKPQIKPAAPAVTAPTQQTRLFNSRDIKMQQKQKL